MKRNWLATVVWICLSVLVCPFALGQGKCISNPPIIQINPDDPSSPPDPPPDCLDPPPDDPVYPPVTPISPTFVCTPSSLISGNSLSCTVTLVPGVVSAVSFTINGGTWTSVAPNAAGTATAVGVLSGPVGPYSIAYSYPGDYATNTTYPAESGSTTIAIVLPPVTIPPPPPNVIYYFRISDTNGYIGYQANGNVQNYTDSVNGTWALGYDNLNRLVSSQQQPINASSLYGCWAYDNFGNMLTQGISTQGFSNSSNCQAQGSATTLQSHAVYSPSNRITSGTWLDASKNTHTGSPQYDVAGNITGDLVNSYLYDAEGRVCAMQSGGAVIGYLHDADGHRVAKGTLPRLTCDPSALQITAEYFIGPDGEVITEVQPTPSGNVRVRTEVSAAGLYLATYTPTGIHYPITDWLGTKRVVINPNQTLNSGIEETCISYPFGDQQICNGTDNSEKHFTGKERDTESGLDYFGARYYASSMGRWMSPDWSASPEAVPYADLANPQSLNLYGYVGNNPLSKADPDGHCTNGGQQKGFWWCAFNDSDQDADRARANLAAYKNISINGKTPSDAAKGLSNTQTVNLDRSVFNYISSQAMSSPGMMIGLAIVPGGAEEVVGREIGAIDVAGVGLGITGTRAATTVAERLAIEAAESNPAAGKVLQTTLNDSRWPSSQGWVKMESRSPGGVVVHWVRNTITGAAADFKLK